MRNWDSRDETATEIGCEWEKDWEDVQRVCRILDIPCKMVCLLIEMGCPSSDLRMQVDLSREYWSRVFEPSLEAWESGNTPNPDVSCNRYAVLWRHIAAD